MSPVNGKQKMLFRYFYFIFSKFSIYGFSVASKEIDWREYEGGSYNFFLTAPVS